MKSFRPIVALDLPLPPPPPSNESGSTEHTFKPHPMYGSAIKLPIAGMPVQSPIAKPSTGSIASIPSSGSSQLESSSGSSSSHPKPSNSNPHPSNLSQKPSNSNPAFKRPSFAPSVTELSSPDNFKDVAQKIKQSVRSRAGDNMSEMSKSSRRSRTSNQKSTASLVVVPSGRSAKGGANPSASNPIFESLREELTDSDTEDTNGVAKPYGSLRNHPLYGRTLSV